MRKLIGLYCVLLLLLLAAPMFARWGEGGPGVPVNVGGGGEGGTLWTTELLETDVATPTAFPELQFVAEGGHAYRLNCTIRGESTNTNTAIRFGLTGPAASYVNVNMLNWTASNGYTLIGYESFGFTQPTLLTSQGPIKRLYQINAVFKTNVDGVVAVTLESETAGVFVTAYEGGYCEYYYEETAP